MRKPDLSRKERTRENLYPRRMAKAEKGVRRRRGGGGGEV